MNAISVKIRDGRIPERSGGRSDVARNFTFRDTYADFIVAQVGLPSDADQGNAATIVRAIPRSSTKGLTLNYDSTYERPLRSFKLKLDVDAAQAYGRLVI